MLYGPGDNLRVEQLWRDRVTELRVFVGKNGRLPHTKEAGYLGRWVNARHTEYRKEPDKSRFYQPRIRELEAIPKWTWTNFDKLGIPRHSAELTEWFKAHPDRIYINVSDRTDFTFSAYHWIEARRNDYRKGVLSPEEIQTLEEIPNWRWNGKNRVTRSKYEIELSYELTCRLDIPSPVFTAQGRLQSWQCDIVIPHHRIAIEYDGWWWHKESHERDIRKTEDLQAAGWNVVRIRELPLDRLSVEDLLHVRESSVLDLFPVLLPRLQSLGCILLTEEQSMAKIAELQQSNWRESEGVWAIGYRKLAAYLEDHGAYPASGYVDEEGFRLGQWKQSQRSLERKGNLISTRKELMHTLPGWGKPIRPMVRLSWEEAYARTAVYMQEFQSGVPSGFKSDDGYTLGAWVTHQRMYSRQGKLPPAKVKLLESLPGWEWNPPAFGIRRQA